MKYTYGKLNDALLIHFHNLAAKRAELEIDANFLLAQPDLGEEKENLLIMSLENMEKQDDELLEEQERIKNLFLNNKWTTRRKLVNGKKNSGAI